MPRQNMIVCDNLVKIYKVADMEVVALQGLNLTVERGELMGIVGTSGSGKSTLLNVLGGLDHPLAGRVTVDGKDLLKLSASELDRYRRQEVGFVWQQTGRNLVPYLSAQQNVELPMTLAGIGGRDKKAWSQELLEAVGLWAFRKSRLQQLSGGQQQRVAIATALANRPKLLLADEPTGELDTATSDEVIALLRQMNVQFGVTVLIVTHDPRVARAVDRVVTIRDGRTSSETVRRVADVEEQLAQDLAETDTTFEEFLVVDAAGRLQLPDVLLKDGTIGDRVTLEKTDAGILIKPVPGRSVTPPTALSEDEPPPASRGRWSKRRRKQK